jgi:hypothetical protein
VHARQQGSRFFDVHARAQPIGALAELARALETADEPRRADLRSELDAAVRGAFGLGR